MTPVNVTLALAVGPAWPTVGLYNILILFQDISIPNSNGRPVISCPFIIVGELLKERCQFGSPLCQNIKLYKFIPVLKNKTASVIKINSSSTEAVQSRLCVIFTNT